MKRLAIIIPDAGEGGLFQFYNQLLPALAKQVEVHVIVASPYHVRKAPNMAGAVVHLLDAAGAEQRRAHRTSGPTAAFPQLTKFLGVAESAWQYAKRLNADVIEVCDWPLGFLPAVVDGTVPYVVQCHGSAGQIAGHDAQRADATEAAFLRILEAQAIADAHNVQTYARTNATFWSSMTRRQVDVIHPAFQAASRAGAIGSERKGIVFGRLQSWKGPDVLCAALRELGTKAPACHWYGAVKPWPGTQIDAASFLKESFPDVWGRTFIHHQAVPRDRVAAIQEGAMFAIVPSHWDVFNFTAVEAMARELPLIVSTGAGAAELIEPGVNGLTFNVGDAHSLATAIANVQTMTPAQRRNMGAAARDTIEQQLRPDRIAEQRLSAYQRAIVQHQSSGSRSVSPWLREVLFPSGVWAEATQEDLVAAMPGRTLLRALLTKSKSAAGLGRSK